MMVAARRGHPMTQPRLTRRLATAAAMTLFAGGIAMAAQNGEPQATIYPISFPMDSLELHQADHETIHGVAAMLERDSSLTATIIGKADMVGSSDYNEHLSFKRAVAVYEALVFAYKVPENRVELRWTGDRLPVVPTGDEQAELQNRVVNIVVR